MNRVPLSQVCRLINGGTPKSGVPEYWGGGVAWLTPAEMGKLQAPEIEATERTITEAGLSNSSAKQVPVGSVIMSTRAPIGHLAIPLAPMAFNQGCRGLVPSEKLDTKYLYYFLWFSRAELNDLGTGTTFKELSSAALGAYKIPLPPLEEQRGIVAVLDEAFAAIAVATANANRNLINAADIFDSELRSLFHQGQAGWKKCKVGEQLTLQRGFDITKGEQRSGPVPVVSSSGIKSSHDTALVVGPGVVIGRKGTLGSVFYLDTDFWPHDTTLWVKDFKGNDRKLIYYLFRALDVKKLDSGAANPALNRNLVHELDIFWPSVELDLSTSDVVSRLEALRSASERAQELYRQKRGQLADLKQSLLHRAFSGELTGREPLAA